MVNYDKYVYCKDYPPSILNQNTGDTIPTLDEGVFETICKILSEQYNEIMDLRAENTQMKLVLINIVEDMEVEQAINNDYIDWIKNNVDLSLGDE